MFQPVRYWHLMVCTFVILSVVERGRWLAVVWVFSAWAVLLYVFWVTTRRQRRRERRDRPC